jgi:hypothetical protein
MRFRLAVIALLIGVTAVAVASVVLNRDKPADGQPTPSAPPLVAASERKQELDYQTSAYPSVPSNRGDVPDGFRGDVHPLLAGQTRLKVTAHWTPIGKGRDQLHSRVSPAIYAWFTSLKPAEPTRTLTERDLSPFLPEQVGEVGQTWAIDPAKVAAVLTQFHPRPSMHLVAQGRRAGPDGAFAVLRAVSGDYLDIAIRVHAEFFVTPPDWSDPNVTIKAWYTPAYFTGRVLVNRRAGTVEYFRLALVNDKALNVHLTMAFQDAQGRGDFHDIVRVERMELVGGDAAADDKAAWTKSLGERESERKLAKLFFKFLEIDWLAFEKVANKAKAKAKAESKPILAIISWGSFEDQSC